MEYGTVAGIEKAVSRLVQGVVPIDSMSDEQAFALLDGVLALGCTAFDTAHVYGGGKNERMLGKWIRDRGVREKIVLITKGAHHNQDRKRVTPFDIAADLHDSLARLHVDYVDLYLLHRDDPAVPVGPIVEALNEHQRAGRIRAFGGSNWSHSRLQEANEYAAAHGLTGFAASSPNFSLAEQVKEPWGGCISIGGPSQAAARAFYERTQMPVFAWSSLAGGFFSGRLTWENRNTWTDYFMKLAVECYGSAENWKRLERARELSDRYDVDVPQIAMAWVMAQPLNLFALSGCNSPAEYQANAAALELKLTPKELAYLDLASE